MPFRGRDKRRFFNQIGNELAVLAGLVGGVLGWIILGPLGAMLGFWTGLTLSGIALEDGRYIR